jgi:TetR/AcrR family transcriptional regulator, regulator of autoinduction and epiphytic fitness
MARRGEALREHILDTAKLVFLESGFERTSMDAIAARAETSKRSLYAHFPTKDALFLAVVERIRTLFGERMRTPAEYSDQPQEAIALYCGHFLQMLRWSSVGRMLRLGIAEAERLPDLAAGFHGVVFEATSRNLASHIAAAAGLTDVEAETAANELIGLAINPALPRLLFGIDPLADDTPDLHRLAAEVDLDRIRRLIRLVLPAPTEA